ncbi:DUF1772 domain-containing protein [Streptomyces sp. NPDC088387]|uniref:anthrone oxygenase family protein n=1 Tax=Streptomyces sp. NPDC088387 TaxID=3365859 RepID=UPI003814A9DF
METNPNRITGAVLGAATVTVGLIAGTFFIFAVTVMPALAHSDDDVYVQVMSDIDDAIYNPLFLGAFMAALLLTAVAAWRLRGRPGPRAWMWAALVAYGLTFLITMGINVPLNEDLVSSTDPVAARADFEDPWVLWNGIRAATSALALAFLAWGSLLYGRERRAAARETAPMSSTTAPGPVGWGRPDPRG